ncbi:MAG: penicillin acylase family protein, partial [Actinobacteria bacterium]|nr:penicillin acylase family protein [Actinomycetota bacterium]
MRLRAATVLAAVAALVAIAAPPALAGRLAPGQSRSSVAAAGLSAQIRYTTGGIPHVLAHGWTSLGFGYGYAFAKDNLCTMANDYVTVEAQRSRYFGPTGVDIQRGNGVVVSNLDSDLFFQQIIDSGVVQHLAQALTPAEKQVETGYTKGYNAYLAHAGGAAGVPDPACRGQAWVKPITVLDSYLRLYQLMLLGSSDAVIQGIAGAAPPKAGAAAAPASAA